MDIITKYFTNLSEEQKKQFAQLPELYQYWNERINVISRKDIENLEERHILHSLAIAKVLDFKAGSKILDVGTGGGFPGIPLAIMFPSVSFMLVDSIAKKIQVVSEVVQVLNLKNVEYQQARVEKMKEKYDFVISRAVTQFPDFVNLVHKRVGATRRNSLPNGIVYLKGGDFENELVDFQRSISVFNISDFFEEAFFETKKIIHLTVPYKRIEKP